MRWPLATKTVPFCFDVDPGQTGRSHITEVGGSAVRSIKLDDYIDAAQLDRVDLVKLDVEGYELSALRGAERALKNRTVQAVYFEYFEKYLVRVAPPQVLLEYLELLGFEVCFCRHCDFESRGTPTLTLKKGLPGHGLPLLAVKGHRPPAMTEPACRAQGTLSCHLNDAMIIGRHYIALDSPARN
jgi:hypothetical protein